MYIQFSWVKTKHYNVAGLIVILEHFLIFMLCLYQEKQDVYGDIPSDIADLLATNGIVVIFPNIVKPTNVYISLLSLEVIFILLSITELTIDPPPCMFVNRN